MTIESNAFAANGTIPPKYTCEGEGTSPPLTIQNVPADAKSLALVMDDPDAPSGTFTHWTLWNVPPTTGTFEEGITPQGAVEGLNSAGKSGYMGPCPPDREHRYFFHLYALDTLLDLRAGAPRAALEEAMKGHVLVESELVGRYDRKR